MITTNISTLSRLVLTGLTLASLFLGRSACAQTLFVAESSGGYVTKIAPDGSAIGLVGADSGLHEPLGLAFDAAGNLYVADFAGNAIKKITSAGVVSLFATAGLSSPAGLAFDAAGNLYVANYGTNSVEIFSPAGVGFTFTSDGVNAPTSLAFDKAGNLYVANSGTNTITEYTPAGAGTAFAAVGLNNPAGLALNAAGNLYASNAGDNTIVMFTPAGAPSYFATAGLDQPSEMAFDTAGSLYVANFANNSIVKFPRQGAATSFVTTGLSGPTGLAFAPMPSFFDGEAYLGSGAYYLRFTNGDYFGYYSFLSDFHYIYHYDLGYEYVFDAADGKSGVYLYDFKSGGFFYTSPTFPFPYLYDFSLNTVLYYYPDPNNAGHYNTNGVRYFYDFATGKVITK